MAARLCFALLIAAGFVTCRVALLAEEPKEYEVTDANHEHWSFRSIARPAVPSAKHCGWVRTPIDAFILAKLEEAEWQRNARPNVAICSGERLSI